MFAAIENVLTADEVKAIRETLDEAEFVDGKATAGGVAKAVKNNKQFNRGDDQEMANALDRVIIEALNRNENFLAMTIPRRFATPLYARYEPGMEYGDHVDAAVMGIGSPQPIRADISCTIFLNEPDEYEGGELVIGTSVGEYADKLSAGSAIMYPATSLHRVEPVTEGQRLVSVTWIQSIVCDAEIREMLYDINFAMQSLIKVAPQSEETERLTKTYQNLLRKFGEV